MPLSEKVEISISEIHGNCWRAKEDIKDGELIWINCQEEEDLTYVFHKDEVKEWPEENRKRFYSLAYLKKKNYFIFKFTLILNRYQIDDGTFRAPYSKDKTSPQRIKDNYYINHCCDGNMWYDTDDKLVACRDIKKGEELAYDYALTETEPTFSLTCGCNTKLCRGVMSGMDYKLPHLREKYANHFLTHVEIKFAAENK